MNNVKPTGQEPHAAPRKATYQKPEIEVTHMEQEGVIAFSGSSQNNPGTRSYSRGNRSQGYSRSASTSELEDLINDILTIEQ